MRFSLIASFFLVAASLTAVADESEPIKLLRGVTPEAGVFQAATRQKPLQIKSREEAAKHFTDLNLARLTRTVDFGKQTVLVFAWRGSGQDKLTFELLESFAEQVVFHYAPGRTRDLRPHTHTFVLRSNVKWRVGANRQPAPVRKPNSAMAKITDDPALPRVLLIGDSISIGYTVPTREALKGKANVHRPLTNCGPTTKGLDEIDSWIGNGKWDVIHFNWGLHDLKYMGPNGQNLADPDAKDSKQQVEIEQYEKNLETLVARLKKTNAKLIWRNTTPVPPGCKGRVAGDSARYNAAAARVMRKHNIPTHDLFTYSKDRMDKIMRDANVHFLPEGSTALGKEVAMVIEKALAEGK